MRASRYVIKTAAVLAAGALVAGCSGTSAHRNAVGDHPSGSDAPASASEEVSESSQPTESAEAETETPAAPPVKDDRDYVIVKRGKNKQLVVHEKHADSAQEVQQKVDKARANPDIIGAAPDVEGTFLSAPPNEDSYARSSAYFERVGACCGSWAGAKERNSFIDSWSLIFAENKANPQPKQPVIAVLDTGFAAENPELEGSAVTGYNATATGPDVPEIPVGPEMQDVDPNAHGTRVSSVIVAKRNNGDGVPGLASVIPESPDRPDKTFVSPVKISPYLVAEQGASEPNLRAVMRALETIANLPKERRPDVALMAMKFGDNPEDPALATDIASVLQPLTDELTQKGVLVIAAAAKATDHTKIAPPAGLPNVLSVGGWKANGKEKTDSSPTSKLLDIVAPAEGVWVINADPKISKKSYVQSVEADGQSFAAAMAAAAAGLRQAWRKGDQPNCPTSDNARHCVQLLSASITGTSYQQPDIEPHDQDFQGQGMLSIPAAIAAEPEALSHFAVPMPKIVATGTEIAARGDGTYDISVRIDKALPAALRAEVMVWVNGIEVAVPAEDRGSDIFTIKAIIPAPTAATEKITGGDGILLAVTAYVPGRGEGLAGNLVKCTRANSQCTVVTP